MGDTEGQTQEVLNFVRNLRRFFLYLISSPLSPKLNTSVSIGRHLVPSVPSFTHRKAFPVLSGSQAAGAERGPQKAKRDSPTNAAPNAAEQEGKPKIKTYVLLMHIQEETHLKENSLAKQPPPDTSSLPLWARTLLARVQSGIAVEDARNMNGSMVSGWTIDQLALRDPVYARAWSLALLGTHVMGEGEARQLAGEYAGAMVADAVHDSRDTTLKAGPRLGNRRLVLEVAGSIQSRNAPGAAIQINVFESGSLSQHISEARAASKERARGSQQSSGEDS